MSDGIKPCASGGDNLTEPPRRLGNFVTDRTRCLCALEPRQRALPGSPAGWSDSVEGREAFARTIDVLQSAGVDIDAVDATGNTPLALALESGQTHRATTLLDLGADPMKIGATGNEPSSAIKTQASLASQEAAALSDRAHKASAVIPLPSPCGLCDRENSTSA